MNVNMIINMVIRSVTREVVNRGVNGAINSVGSVKKKPQKSNIIEEVEQVSVEFESDDARAKREADEAQIHARLDRRRMRTGRLR